MTKMENRLHWLIHVSFAVVIVITTWLERQPAFYEDCVGWLQLLGIDTTAS